MGSGSKHFAWITRHRLGAVGTLGSLAWSFFSVEWHPGGVVTTEVLFGFGVAALLASIVVLVWDAPRVVSLRIRAASPYAAPPALPPEALAQTLAITWEEGAFYATDVSYLRPGTILFMVCVNTSPDQDVQKLRVRADTLTSPGTAVPANGFTPGFLESEMGGVQQDLPPGSTLRFPIARHDSKRALFAQMLPQTTGLPAPLEAGRWCAGYTLSAQGLRPLTASVTFSCGQPPSVGQPGELKL